MAFFFANSSAAFSKIGTHQNFLWYYVICWLFTEL
jgi:hypothetical protein